MAGLTPTEVAQLYNGIYSAPTPAPGGPLPTMSVEEMYRGIYPASTQGQPALVPNPPMPGPTGPSYDVYKGIYGPGNLASEPGAFPNFGSLADMFPGSSQTKTQIVQGADANGVGYGSGFDKGPQERLLPSGLGFGDGVGAPPATRRVQSAPVQGNASMGLPRRDPRGYPGPMNGVGAMPEIGSIAAMFTPPPARAPLRISVNGANAQPYPAPASQRPAAPARPSGLSAVDQLRSQGLSPSDAYAMANQQARERAYESAHGSSDTRSDYFKSVTGG